MSFSFELYVPCDGRCARKVLPHGRGCTTKRDVCTGTHSTFSTPTPRICFAEYHTLSHPAQSARPQIKNIDRTHTNRPTLSASEYRQRFRRVCPRTPKPPRFLHHRHRRARRRQTRIHHTSPPAVLATPLSLRLPIWGGGRRYRAVSVGSRRQAVDGRGRP